MHCSAQNARWLAGGANQRFYRLSSSNGEVKPRHPIASTDGMSLAKPPGATVRSADPMSMVGASEGWSNEGGWRIAEQ